MNDDKDQRTFGMLIEQGKWVAKKIEDLERKVDQLLSFKWRIYGATAIIAFIVTASLEVYWRVK